MPQRISGNVKHPLQWSEWSTPGLNVDASAVRPAMSGVVHVCTGITLCVLNVSNASSVQVQWELVDGTLGPGTILLAGWIGAPPNGFSSLVLPDLNVPGSAGNPMTLAFDNSAISFIYETALLTGYEL